MFCMPYDICMCPGGDCPQKKHCLRYTGKVRGRQDFFGSAPFDKKTGLCDHFYDDRPKHDQIQELAYWIWEEKRRPASKDLEIWLEAEKILQERIRDY
ncbi:MAG TPA: DUF2934 domain-containing protein [Leptospiraceae bacterium]|nr:DUF2934 domain-containing protein [Leptospiraceae bacterium]HNM05368.1 DUF2934 domain-containing protein [Leptospiraceae bacterium]